MMCVTNHPLPNQRPEGRSMIRYRLLAALAASTVTSLVQVAVHLRYGLDIFGVMRLAFNGLVVVLPLLGLAVLGLELGLANHVYLVGEITTEPEGASEQPWAAGLQVRHPDGFGFTLSYLQNGSLADESLYIGVGINFL